MKRRSQERIRQLEDNSSMYYKKFLGTLSKSGPKSKKKLSTGGTLRTRKEEPNKVVQQGRGIPVISLKRLRKVQKRMKKRRRKLGSPIIVEDTAGDYPSIPLPATLRQASVQKPAEIAVSLGSFCPEKTKNIIKGLKEVRITVVDCIDPRRENVVKKQPKSEPTNRPSEESMEQTVELPESDLDFSTQTVVETLEEIVEPTDENFDSSYNSANEQVTSLDENSEEIETKRLPRFYSFRNKVLTIIEPDCKFCFHGKLRLRVLYGAVRIYGVSLNSAKTRVPMTIYSPRACSPIAIEATESEIHDRDIPNVWETLGEQCTDRKVAKRLQSDISNVDDGWAIIELKNFDNELTTFLGNCCPFGLFPRIDDPSNHSWRETRRAEIVLQANIRVVDHGKKLSIGSPAIDDLADGICYDWEIKGTSRTVIAGGKGVGKSTTARYVVNKLLGKSKEVVFLDFDPGQAEFTPAECISLSIIDEPLLGPNFTHLKTPYYQLYVGSVDVRRCFTQYLNGIKKLVDRISEDTRLMHLPVVVNTMGFCRGIGWDIINYVIKVVSPTDVVQIRSRRSKNNFEDALSRQVIDRQSPSSTIWRKDTMNKDKPTKHRLHVIFSEVETRTGSVDAWNLEPHQKRDLVMLAYLSQILGSNRSSALLQSRPLTSNIYAVPPYTIPFSAISVALAGAFIPQVLSVMNGNIVALCGIDSESTEESNTEENISTGYPRVLIRPPLSTCYGLGILRGVDMEKERIFLNTPLSAAHMEHVNCLIGCIKVPSSLRKLNQQGAPYTGSQYDLPISQGPRRGYSRMRYQVAT